MREKIVSLLNLNWLSCKQLILECLAVLNLVDLPEAMLKSWQVEPGKELFSLQVIVVIIIGLEVQELQ